MTGMDRCVEMTERLGRSGASSVAGHSAGPTPGPEAEEAGGSVGCNAGTDPRMTEEQLDWGWQKGLPRGARWYQELGRGSNR